MTFDYSTAYSDEHRYTTDHDAIRNWAQRRDAIPVTEEETSGDFGEIEATPEADEAVSSGGDTGAAESTSKERVQSGSTDEEADHSESGRVDYRFVPRSEREAVDEEEAWEEFREAFDPEEYAFVYEERGDDAEEIETHGLAPADAVTESEAREIERSESPSNDR